MTAKLKESVEKVSGQYQKVELRRRAFLAGGAIIVLALISFSPTFDNGFTNWDDPVYVTGNPAVRDLSWTSIREIFSIPSAQRYSHYIPLVILSYAIEYRVAGLTPWVYHATNLILHISNSLLVLWLVYKMTGKFNVGVVVAVLFAIHPMRVESVVWITERKDVLSAFFFFLSLLCYVSYTQAHRTRFYVLSFLCFILSLSSKAMAITMPFLLVLIDYFLPRKFDKRALIEKLPFFLVSLGFGLLVLSLHHPAGIIEAQRTSVNPPPFILHERLLFAGYNVAFYLAKLLAPINLSILYLYPEKNGPWLPLIYYVAQILVLVLTVILFLSRSGTKIILFGSAWFIVTILPVLQLIPAGVAIAADRFTYIPYVGLFYLVAEGLLWFYRQQVANRVEARVVFVLGCLALLVGFSARTYQRSAVWRSSVTLWTDYLEHYAHHPMAYNNRGQAFMQATKVNDALRDFDQAIRLDSTFVMAYNNRGNLHARTGAYEEALRDYSKAIALDTLYADVHNNRGKVYALSGKFEDALRDFDRSLVLDDKNPVVFNNRAELYFRIGDFNKAVEDYSRALLLDNRNPQAYTNRGNAYANLGRLDEAIADYNEALRLVPNYVDAYRNRESVIREKSSRR